MRKTIILLMLLLFLSSAYALEVYIRPPRMIARINLSETNVWHGFIEVKNNNNYTVSVSFKPVGDIVDKISIAEKIQLKPGELRQENFTLKVDKAGRYDGGVIVTYEKEGEVPVALQAEIIVLATGERKNQIPYLYFLIPLLLVLLVIALKRFAKIFLIALLILPLAEGANIALVVKNASNLDYVHEYRIHRILKDMGHDVILIDANNYQSYDFNTFSAIVIAGRPSNVYAHQYLDDFVATLPVNSKPTIAIDSAYPDDFGWIYPGAIGSVFSSNIIYLNVIDNSTMLAGFPIGSRMRSHIINNYPVLNLEITRSALTPAATLVSSNQYAVIAYAEAGTVLINNNITSARVVFFGVTQPLYWTDEVEVAFKNSVNWLLNGEFVVPTRPFLGEYSLLQINVYGDSSKQFLVDLGRDGVYEKYWDPSRGIVTNLLLLQPSVYAIDVDSDGKYDYIYENGFLKGLPDLLAESIIFLNEPIEGGTLNIRITTKNIGNSIARNFKIVVMFDSTYLDSRNIQTLEANQQHSFDLIIQNLPKGQHEIKVIVDQENKVFERDEGNNYLTKSYVISYQPVYEKSSSPTSQTSDSDATTTTVRIIEQGNINITMPNKVELLQGENVFVEIKFYNPLDYPIYNISVLVDVDGFNSNWYSFVPKEIDVLKPKEEKVVKMKISLPLDAKIYTYKFFFRFPSRSEYGTKTYTKIMHLQIKERELPTTTPVVTTTTIQEKQKTTGLIAATVFKWTAIVLAILFLSIIFWYYYPKLFGKKGYYIVGKGWKH